MNDETTQPPEGENGEEREREERERNEKEAAARNPAAEQAPTATERQEAIQGDPGLREQDPMAAVDDSANTPVRTSAPPPGVQTGVPLAEDRAAGVEPGSPGPEPPPHSEGGSLGGGDPEPGERDPASA